MGELGSLLDGGGVNPDDIEPGSGTFEPMPAGWVGVEIEKAFIKGNSKKTGKIMKVEASVFDENYTGRKVFCSINISNPSTQCEEIGLRELADLARACGIPFLDDEDKLIGKRLEMKLAVCKNQNGEPDNEVKGYRACGSDGTTKPKAKPKSAKKKTEGELAGESQVPPASGKRPWE